MVMLLKALSNVNEIELPNYNLLHEFLSSMDTPM